MSRVAFVLVSLWALHGFAAPAPSRPTLAVILVIDQLSADHLNRRIDEGRAPTLAKLFATGHRFDDARYEAAPALTAPGHATLATGAYPHLHGVVGNEWFDAKLDRFANCVEDPAYKTLGRDPKPLDGTAPTVLRAPTLGESLKLHYPASKVVGIAGKDRAAILLAGRGADLALWLDDAAPRFVTSSYYAENVPAWVDATNEKLAKALAAGFTWSLPRGGVTGKNPPPEWARDMYGFGKGFPHSVQTSGAPHDVSDSVLHNPAVESLVVDLALDATKNLELGKDASPDLLTVSFSSFDKILHAFGPESEEAGAAITAIDSEIARLLAGLDAQVGKGNYVVVFTADHGGLPVPETLQPRHIDSGRLDTGAFCGLLDTTAKKALGEGKWIAGWKATGCYATTAARASVHNADAAIVSAGSAVKGVRRLMTKPSLTSAPTDDDDVIARLYRRGLDPERSPDFIVATEPFWMFGPKDAAGHGSWHLYDRHVPLVFFGAGIAPGHGDRAETIDVAPTLARILGCDPPADAEGHVLTEALAR